MAEKARDTNGRSVRVWVIDLVLALLVPFLIGILSWGLKLESELNQERTERRAEYNAIRDDIADLQKQVGNGILPRAEERIESLDERIRDLEDED